MTIEIRNPEIERIVDDAVRSGRYRSAQEVITEAVTSWYGQRDRGPLPQHEPSHPHAKNLVELFANSPFKGLEMDFERDKDTGRDIEL